MSLQLAAQHLASHGRGDDKVLVHMTPGEVKSLNDLAMAHGGHLTINPHTGLPEAGFLSSLLPMVAGGAISYFSGGAIDPMTAAGMVGGGVGLMTGSVQKGLMAGLGAYGGAGIGSSISTMGTGAGSQLANAEAATSAQSGVDAEVARQNAAIAQQNAQNAATASGRMTPQQMEQMISTKIQPYTPSQIAEMSENLGNQTGMKISSANPYATPFTQGTQEALANPTQTGLSQIMSSPSAAGQFAKDNWKTLAAAALPLAISTDKGAPATPADNNPGPKFSYAANPTPAATGAVPNPNIPSYADMRNNPRNFGAEQRYFNPYYTQMAAGGPVESMSNNAAIGANTMYPMANMATSAFATPYQTPQSTNMMQNMAPSGGGTVDQMSGEPNMQGTRLATGGISDARYNLGSYSDGGRLLRGPGDGVSDDIPATIGEKQPARLADGEFVVPARIVSELGNGSTEAGARKLYAMMDRVQGARKQTVGKDRIAHNSRADKYLPA